MSIVDNLCYRKQQDHSQRLQLILMLKWHKFKHNLLKSKLYLKSFIIKVNALSNQSFIKCLNTWKFHFFFGKYALQNAVFRRG